MIRMQELNAPVASLLTTPNWEVLLTLWRDKRPCRGIWIDWSIGQPSMAWNLTRTRAGFCTWDRVTRDTSVNGERSGWRAALQRGPWGAGGQQLHRSQQRALAAPTANCTPGASNTAQPPPAEGTVPLDTAWCGLPSSAGCRAGPHHFRRL